MQNNSNSNMQRGQGPQQVEYLQRHITELTNYINENNQKYHKNMVTLKEFYEEQAQDLHQHREGLLADNTRLNNQVVTLRDLLSNSNIRIRQLQDLLRDSQLREEELRDKLERERKRNQAIYEDIEAQRRQRQNEIEKYKGRINQLEQEQRKLSGEVFKRQTSIETLNKKRENLESIVNQNYLLPERIQDLQKDQAQFQGKLKDLSSKNRGLTEEINQLQVRLGKLQTENQSLRIFKANASSQKKLELERAIKQQKEQADGRAQKLEKENQAYIFQLNEAESRIKYMGRDVEGFERQIVKMRERAAELQGQVAAVDRQKSDYLAEFSSLKQQYDAVIQRLEDSLISYQKKSWTLEQQNKDLNLQLSSLQELLTEVKAINNLQAHKPEYRRLAEMELLARKEQFSPLKEEGKAEEEEGSQKEWEKLMQDIERIAV